MKSPVLIDLSVLFFLYIYRLALPYRTKLFIGINVRKIRDCQKPQKILTH